MDRILNSNTSVGRPFTPCTWTIAGSARAIPIRAGRMTAAPGRECRIRTAIANLRRGCYRIGKRPCESNLKRDSEMTTSDLFEPRVVGWSFDERRNSDQQDGCPRPRGNKEQRVTRGKPSGLARASLWGDPQPPS